MSTRQLYSLATSRFEEFRAAFPRLTDACNPLTVALYIAFLSHRGLAPSTITTYVSAVNHFQRLKGLPSLTDSYLVQKALQGLRNINPQADVRLPISLPILQQLIDIIPRVVSNTYESSMYRAMFSLAFYAFLRIGELTYVNRGRHTLPFCGVQFFPDKLIITFTSYKHSRGKPVSITIRALRHAKYCPVYLLSRFCQVRGSQTGYLFTYPDASPVPRSAFVATLSQCLRLLHLDTSYYKGHSFRIGAATYASSLGCSDSQIRVLGRWRSDAFKKYIR